MNIGELIKSRRKELNISASELAEFVGVSESTIFRYEKGEIEKMPTTTLEKIAEKLRTTPGHLLGWDDVSQSNNNPYVETIAAHIDDDLTEEQMNDIIKYIEFIKTKKF
ncbi:helix-turn-helix transcriptional regulator [Macrococcus caseolyticus]|uniref:helix-turn-helix domain-containing protein n=1 Tax=Macrococcoides caseolyticum TaxID=69966 RepID=UPI0024BC7DAC|nr:helix-turn-helix transcriptional regulator [Macrococcus caseolyticus]MDJ1090687.1 helix-turn-helix transcriptional regulator [Macrococcus caseolyticus]